MSMNIDDILTKYPDISNHDYGAKEVVNLQERDITKRRGE